MKTMGIVAAALMFLVGCGEAQAAGSVSADPVSNKYLLEAWSCKGVADFGNSAFEVEHGIYYFKDYTMSVCSVVDNNRASSMTYIMVPSQIGFSNGSCVVKFDVDAPSRGYFDFTFNTTAKTSIVHYNDAFSDMSIVNLPMSCTKI